MASLVVFPDAPLLTTLKKGEVKAGYYNPDNLFDRVLVVSPADEVVPADRIRAMVGKAELSFYASGWTSRFSMRTFPALRGFLRTELERMLPTLRAFAPDATRGYGPQIPSWFAVHAAKQLGIPSVVSLHADYDRDVRGLLLRDRRWRPFVAHTLLKYLVEADVITNADAIICVYRFIIPYAEKRKAHRIEVIYNRVDTNRFRLAASRAGQPFTVLIVSRLDIDKDPSNVVRAMASTEGRLRIVGDGPLGTSLRDLAASLGIADRVEFVPTIHHSGIHEAYRDADVYAAVYRLGGVSIPALEAMASGLPVVAARTEWEPAPELVSDVGMVVDNTPQGFAAAFGTLRDDAERRAALGRQGRELLTNISGVEMGKREAALYQELIARKRPLRDLPGAAAP